ncbi:ladderlectin-like [Mizuhopecten yessoensis]|uniref:C-type lectin domain family 4 member C n=1 Tax=Mizuhopecten yessoensis TaxID=6573 RepID=A0A210PVG3_MIZYE|nr:ladderlectin-like [Mizuhopecten yessoensis]OWF40455.1 C-type lectin domain family 4 member C [Mizuhopecten yessoensis]
MDVKTLLLLLPVVYSACPSPWNMEFQSSCYMIVTEMKPWAEADRNCGLHHPDGHLVKIETAEEQTFLTNYVKAHQAHLAGELWTDGTDVEVPREFVWDYGYDHFVYANWKHGEPNNQGGHEHCVEYGKSYNYQWNDIPCNNHYQSICEFEKTV